MQEEALGRSWKKLGIRHGHGPRGSNIEELRRTKKLKN
jgi:hypothetical protein